MSGTSYWVEAVVFTPVFAASNERHMLSCMFQMFYQVTCTAGRCCHMVPPGTGCWYPLISNELSIDADASLHSNNVSNVAFFFFFYCIGTFKSYTAISIM